MPKQTLTLNGFAGGLNLDADESDLASSGQGEDEVQESKNFFLDKRGKIVTEYPEIGDDGTSGTGVSEDSGNNTSATKALVYTQKLYQQTGIFKVGEDINYKANGDFFAYKPAMGDLNEGYAAADEEKFGVDIDVLPNIEYSHLFLGINAVNNTSTRGGQTVKAIYDRETTMFEPGYRVRYAKDTDNDGQTTDGTYVDFEDLTAMDTTDISNADGAALYDAQGNEIDISSITANEIKDMNATANTTADYFAIHKGSGSGTNDNVLLCFRVGHSDADPNNPDADEGDYPMGVSTTAHTYYGSILPGSKMIFELYVADLEKLENIYILFDSQTDDQELGGFTLNKTDSSARNYAITPKMIRDANGVGAWVTYELDYDTDQLWVGSSYTEAEIYHIWIAPKWTGVIDNNETNGIIRIRQISFQHKPEEAYLWMDKKFRLSQTTINAKGIESTPKIYDGTFSGNNAKQKFTIYKPGTSGLAGKIYYEETDETGISPKTGMFLLAEYDYTNGVKNAGSDQFASWVVDGTYSNYVEFELDDPPLVSTYGVESGYPSDTSTINALWECSATVGRQAYIGNCAKEVNQQVIDLASENITTVANSGSSRASITRSHSWTNAYTTFSVADEDAASGMTEGQYVTLVDYAGTSKNYVVCDDSQTAVTTGTVLTSSSDIGSDTLGNLTDLTAGVAVVLDTTTTGGASLDDQNEFLKQLEIAVEHTDGHNGTIAVTGYADGSNTILLTQNGASGSKYVSGADGNTKVTSTVSNLTAPDFKNGDIGFDVNDQIYITGNNTAGNNGLYVIHTDFANSGGVPNNIMYLTTVLGDSDSGMNSGLFKAVTFDTSSDASLILKSAVGRAGGFSDTTYIDLEFGGDTLKVLETIGDRLFAFSQNQLTVINVAQDIEFVESTLPGQGVNLHRQVCKFNDMLAFVNSSGVYMFNGEGIVNISDLKLMSAAWSDDNCAAIFDAKRTMLVIWSAASKQYYYSPIFQQWVGESAVASEMPTTNASIADKQYSYYKIGTGNDVRILGADSVAADSANRDVELITGKISCGNIAQRKNFYKLYITAKNAENLDIWIKTDDSQNNSTTITVNHIPTSDLLTSGFSGGEATLELLDATRANYDDSGSDYFTLTDIDGTAKTYIFDTATASGSTGTVQGGTGYIFIGMSDVTETVTAIATNVKNAIEHANGHGPGKFKITQNAGLLTLESYAQVFNSDTADLVDGVNEISLRSSGLLSSSCKGKWIKIRLIDDNSNASAACVISDISIVFKGRAIK